MKKQNSESPKGLTCYVYRAARPSMIGDRPVDCTNGGISSRVTEVTLIGLGQDAEIFEPTPDRPAVRLVTRKLNGELYMHATPVDQPKGMVGPCAGGNFIYSCDSRFPSPYPLSLHDRFDTAEDWEHLTR